MFVQFASPLFLFALSALAVPIIVHLYNFRRYKKIYFTNVRFLHNIQQTTRSQSRLKHLLILACRLSAILFLVFAFAQPFLVKQRHSIQGSNTNYVSVFVDNSFSMNGKNENGTLLKEAIQKAEAIVSAYKPSDKFQLLTNDFTSSQQHFISREEFIKQLTEVKLSSASHSFREIMAKQTSALAEVRNVQKNTYIISDFQKTLFNENSYLKADSSISVNFLPLHRAENNNLYIDTCYFESPVIQAGQASKLIIKVKNIGSKDVENIPLKLTLNGRDQAMATVTCNKNEMTQDTLTFTPSQAGWNKATVSLSDYPIIFDDDYYVSFFIAPSINLLCINGALPNRYIHSLFDEDPYIKIADLSATQVNYAPFSTANTIILNELPSIPSGLQSELLKAFQKGTSIVVFPCLNMDPTSYNSFLNVMGAPQYVGIAHVESKMEKIDKQNLLLKDVFKKNPHDNSKEDLPIVRDYCNFSKSSSGIVYKLIALENGDPFLLLTKNVKGNLYQFSSPLNISNGNFPEHALFVPVMYKIALNSLHNEVFDYTIGHNSIPLHDENASNDNTLHLINADKHFDIIPERKTMGNTIFLELHDQITEAGNYEIQNEKSHLGIAAFNYDRRESDMTTLSNAELENITEKSGIKKLDIIDKKTDAVAKSITQSRHGIALWKLCIVLVLLSLATEIALIKFLK